MSLIYKPKGAAGEYARYAVNFYNGCPNGCTYCYNKRGLAKNLLGKDEPTIKKGYDDWTFMVDAFMGEALKMIDELRAHGIFMSFTTDPLTKTTVYATMCATEFLTMNKIPTYILSKGNKIPSFLQSIIDWREERKKYIHFGVTLTGCDEFEPNALPNDERIRMLSKAKEFGINTFVSLEPIIDLKKSLNMVRDSFTWVDEYRIGLLTPVRPSNYPLRDIVTFIRMMKWYQIRSKCHIMWKESFIKLCRKYDIEDYLNHLK